MRKKNKINKKIKLNIKNNISILAIYCFCTLFFIHMFVLQNIQANTNTNTNNKNKTLKKPINLLFKHNDHIKNKKNTNCTECHPFSIKALNKGPLAKPVNQKYLLPSNEICHRCHLGKVTTANLKQCQVCHLPNSVKPKSHYLSWQKRHGNYSQLHNDNCRECHQKNECNTCHLKVDSFKSKVHRGNIKITHSIQARAKPQSCVYCHQTQNFCRKCHMSEVKK